MNVYDFDKTIYPADSTAGFYRWCLRRYPMVRLSLPRTAVAFFCMGTRLLSKTRAKELFYRFLRRVPAEAPFLYWRERIGRIQVWYLEQKRPDDVIISASPEFLLRPAAEALGVRLIASRVDPATGKYTGLNCHGEEKVRRFRAQFPGETPENFWSDSRSDTPMARLSARAYIIRNGRSRPWPRR